MDNTREKLIALLKLSDACLCDLCGEDGAIDRVADVIAENLIANGVTFATDNKWIPVTERLPEKYGEYIVAVREETNEMYTDYADYDPYVKSWKTGLFLGLRDKVTHWMPLPSTEGLE